MVTLIAYVIVRVSKMTYQKETGTPQYIQLFLADSMLFL